MAKTAVGTAEPPESKVERALSLIRTMSPEELRTLRDLVTKEFGLPLRWEEECL